jgi:hypothetical protein
MTQDKICTVFKGFTGVGLYGQDDRKKRGECIENNASDVV